MSIDKCLLEVGKMAGRALDPEESKALTSVVKDLVDRAKADTGPGTLNEKVGKLVDKVGKDLKEAAIIKKREAALNHRAVIEHVDRIMRDFEADPTQGLRALLEEDPSAAFGSKDSLHANVSAEKAYQIGNLVARLEKAGVTKITRSSDPAIQKQLFNALYELGAAKPDSAKLNAMPPEILDAAKILYESSEMARTRFNSKGGSIGKLESRVMRQTHDQIKVAKAGGKHVGHPDNNTAWVSYVSERLDFEKSFPTLTREKAMQTLERIYESIRTGTHVRFSDQAASSGHTGFSNIAKKYDKARTLHFKNAEAAWSYHEKFGSGNNVGEMIAQEIHKTARDTAIMAKLGVSAEGNTRAIVDRIVSKLDKAGRYDDIAKLQKEYKRIMENVWPNITDGLGSSGDNMFAQGLAKLRGFQYTVFLGGSMLSQVSDNMFAGLAHRYVTSQDMSGMMRGLGGHISGMLEHMDAKTKARVAEEMGVLFEYGDAMPGKYDVDSSIPGQTAKYIETVNKLNLIGWWQTKSRIAGTMLFSNILDNNKRLSFDKLEAGTKSYMEQFGITPLEWDIVRAVPSEAVDGRKMLSPKAALRAKLDAYRSIPEVAKELASIEKNTRIKNKPKAIENALVRGRDRLHSKMGSMFFEYATMVATEPSAVDRAMINQGTKAGTTHGELLRSLMMFKSFPLTVMRKHLNRELKGYSKNSMTTWEAMKLMASGNNQTGLGGIASVMALAPIYGYTSMVLKDLSKGITPVVPETQEDVAKTLMAASKQAGGLGIFGDFLFGEQSRFGGGVGQTLLGPSIGGLAQAADIAMAGVYGARDVAIMGDSGERLEKEVRDTGAKATQFLMNHIPGRNLFYTRLAIDLAVGYRLREAMSPGSLRRTEDRMRREKGQEFIFNVKEFSK